MKNGKTILYRVYQGAMALALRVLPEKKQELVTGNGSFLKAAVILKQHGVHKVQIVTTAGTVRRGTLAPLLSELESKGIEAAVFDGVRPDPDLSCIEHAAKSYRDEGCDAFLSVGGGSAIDAAKGMWLFYEHPDTSFDGLRLKIFDVRSPPLSAAFHRRWVANSRRIR